MSGRDYPQVGRGWAFPPRWVPVRAEDGTLVGATVAMSDGERHVAEAMRILLRTELGGRVMRPTVGAGIDRYVFEPRTSDVCYRLADDVRRALVLGEPRVIVDAVEAVPAGEADDRIDVRIDFRIDRHRRPTSLVLPFHVEAAP